LRQYSLRFDSKKKQCSIFQRENNEKLRISWRTQWLWWRFSPFSWITVLPKMMEDVEAQKGM
jgi:hypothetical protein